MGRIFLFMSERKEPSIDNYEKEITPDIVTAYYELRSKLWSQTDISRILEVAQAHLVSLPEEYASFRDISSLKKVVLSQWYRENIFSGSREEYEQRMQSSFGEVIDFFSKNNFFLNLHLFGSYSCGKINGIGSDLDFMIVLPEIKNKFFQELEGFRHINKILILSNTLCSLEDLVPIYQTGSGLARLYGFSRRGIEVEFHIIGIKDACGLTKIYPGIIRRVREVSPKPELRTSFTGKRSYLPKDSWDVVNYIPSNDGDFYIGFFPLHIATSDIVYKGIPDNNQQKEPDYQREAFLGLVKGFLYHNGAYVRDENNEIIGIRASFFNSFERFFKIFYYPDFERYTPDKIEEFRKRYLEAISEIALRYNLPFL